MMNIIFICDCSMTYSCTFHWHLWEVEHAVGKYVKADPEQAALAIAKIRSVGAMVQPETRHDRQPPSAQQLPSPLESEDESSGSRTETTFGSEETECPF